MKWLTRFFTSKEKNLLSEDDINRASVQNVSIPVNAQIKTMTIRGVLICHSDGYISNKVPLPALLLHELRSKFSNVGLFVSKGWYYPDWTFDSVVEISSCDDFSNKDEYLSSMGAVDTYDSVIDELKYAINRARINNKTELVVHGGPILMTKLLPYMDILEVYSNSTPGLSQSYLDDFVQLLGHASKLAKSEKSVSIQGVKLILTKGFDLGNFEYSYFVNTKPKSVEYDDDE